MTEKHPVCISCNQRISNTTGSTKFMCPRCAKFQIIRCYHCRKIAAKYKCRQCQFEGPN